MEAQGRQGRSQWRSDMFVEPGYGQDIWANGDRELRRHCNNLSMGSEEGRYGGNTEMTRAYWAGLGG